MLLVYLGVAGGWTGWTMSSGHDGPGGPIQNEPKNNHWFENPSLFLVHGIPPPPEGLATPVLV